MQTNKNIARSPHENSTSDRFQRHSLIPDWRQDHLTRATVIIVGLGALGNEAARILAMTGVGELILCDPDRVEESNLSRTILFRQTDIGRYKVEAAAEAIKTVAPEISVQTRPQPLVHGIGLAELRDASLVLSCLDSRSARLQLAGRCQLVRAPSIDGGTHPWGGEVRPYLDLDGPCYSCSLTPAERGIADAPWSCLDVRPETAVGSAAPSSALIGTWMGMVATRFLMGLPTPPGTLMIDATRGTTAIIQQERVADCPMHYPLDPATKIEVGSTDSLGTLRSSLDKDETPLAWEPVQYKVECPNCGFAEPSWGLPERIPCPRCQTLLRPHTTLDLADAPDDITLTELGIPPLEIITTRKPTGLQWIELNS